MYWKCTDSLSNQHSRVLLTGLRVDLWIYMCCIHNPWAILLASCKNTRFIDTVFNPKVRKTTLFYYQYILKCNHHIYIPSSIPLTCMELTRFAVYENSLFQFRQLLQHTTHRYRHTSPYTVNCFQET